MVIQNCCLPCPTPPVNVPGPEGASGDGKNGTDGVSAFTLTTADFSLPSLNGNITVSVGNSTWMAVGQNVVVSDGTDIGSFQVVSMPTSASVVLKWLDYPGDSSTGTTILSGAIVSPGGKLGPTGQNAFTLTTLNFALPAPSGSVTVDVGNSTWLAIGQNVFISDGTNLGNFKVTALPTTTSVTLTWLDYPGDSATLTTINTGATLSPSGQQGVAGTNCQFLYFTGASPTNPPPVTTNPAIAANENGGGTVFIWNITLQKWN